MIDLSAVVAYLTAALVPGVVVYLIVLSRRHPTEFRPWVSRAPRVSQAGMDKCPVCGRPKKDNAVYAPGAHHPFYYEHNCWTPEGVNQVTIGFYGSESTTSYWYGLENGTVLEPSDIGAAIWGAMWVKHDGKVFSLQEYCEARKPGKVRRR